VAIKTLPRAPVKCEYDAIASIIGSLCFSPEISITRAVRVHKTTVSQKTSKTPRHPCEIASDEDDACAVADVPHPASFDKRPLEKPYLNALEIPKPHAPQTALLNENAPSKISQIATHSPPKLEKTMYNDRITYKIVRAGITSEHTASIRPCPPHTIVITRTASASPHKRLLP
jgi:hypothetical protein